MDNNNTEDKRILSLSELKTLVEENFKQVLEGLENYNSFALSLLQETDAEGRKFMEEAATEFMKDFSLANRELMVTFMKLASAMEKLDGKKETRFGFIPTTGERERDAA